MASKGNNKDRGYFRLYRSSFDGDPFWEENRPRTKWEAWQDILNMAAYAPHRKVLGKGIVIHLERGELHAPLRYLGARWGWDKNKVARYMNALCTRLERLVLKNRDTNGDTYLVVNYEHYQGDRDTKRDADGTLTGRTRDADGTVENKEKKGKKKILAPSAPGFDEFWAAYPRKKSKGDALKAWRETEDQRPPLAVLLAKLAALCASADWQREGGKYVKYPASWLRAIGWEDEARVTLPLFSPAPQDSIPAYRRFSQGPR